MPATARGENQRKLHEGHEQRSPAEAAVCEQIRSRSAEHEDQGRRDEVRLQRDPEGVTRDVAREPVEKLAEGELGEDRDDGKRQEDQEAVVAPTSATAKASASRQPEEEGTQRPPTIRA